MISNVAILTHSCFKKGQHVIALVIEKEKTSNATGYQLFNETYYNIINKEKITYPKFIAKILPVQPYSWNNKSLNDYLDSIATSVKAGLQNFNLNLNEMIEIQLIQVTCNYTELLQYTEQNSCEKKCLIFYVSKY